ncbi:hypothetical protein BN871_GJ_00020 [Paenibacillus sp. P22]|nr:hypothetical protein BN871_GJ_00020 [Paenibacillus sp. P22]
MASVSKVVLIGKLHGQPRLLKERRAEWKQRFHSALLWIEKTLPPFLCLRG